MPFRKLEFVWKKNALKCTIPRLTLASYTERGMLNLKYKCLVHLEQKFCEFRH